MTAALAVLRPEPGNAATAARVEAAGRRAIRLPLFAVRAVRWIPPDPARFDALLLTSANAVRHAGAALDRYRALPVHAVGGATAAAAAGAGLTVAVVGAGDAAAQLARGDFGRALHLAGRDRSIGRQRAIAATAVVYESVALAHDRAALGVLRGEVALLHSVRAAARFAALVDERGDIALAALSPAVRAAAGGGWRAATVAAEPSDPALVAAALALRD